jgi:hypothetical protein
VLTYGAVTDMAAVLVSNVGGYVTGNHAVTVQDGNHHATGDD